MCGLNGIFAYNAAAGTPSEQELRATRDSMALRGPDGAGEWWGRNRRIGLGHRRLSIIDLSDRSLQPMQHQDGRYTVVFNGEIYNHRALRKELEASGHRFQTTSDTEVLLQMFAHHGEAMMRRLRGMFSFAIWDDTKQALFLGRDPYGIKPLYVANDGWTFRFASQVKALLAGGNVSTEPEPAGIVGFHLWGSVPEPFTLYRDIQAFPAGHTQWIDAAGPRKPVAYASIAEELAVGSVAPTAVEELDARVRAGVLDSVNAHLAADVEVGIFLSAGVDSGALLGLMRDAGQARTRAITLAFDEFKGTPEDEAPFAARIANQYGAEHIVRRVDAAEFHSDLPAILAAMDQPSIDGVNTWFVAKAAREVGLKVALSGVGGDEILAGYPSFSEVPRWSRALRIPSAVPGLGRAVRFLGAALHLSEGNPKALGMVEYGGDYAGAYFLKRGLFLPFELASYLDSEVLDIGLQRLDLLPRLRRQGLTPMPSSSMSRVSALEASWYLRNQLLRDTDWAGMAHSLEIRTPLVDFELLKALAPVMPGLKRNSGKCALAKAPSQSLDAVVTHRPKSGFGVPMGRWNASGPSNLRSKGQVSRTWACDIFAQSLGPQPPARSSVAA